LTNSLPFVTERIEMSINLLTLFPNVDDDCDQPIARASKRIREAAIFIDSLKNVDYLWKIDNFGLGFVEGEYIC
jgi:hypothetical protein